MRQILFALLLFSTTLTAQDGWKYIGPVDREIQHMVIHEDLILCAASTVDGDKLFRSTDAGQTWSILPSGVRKMAIIPDGNPTIVGSIPPNRDFMISTDLGETWDTTGTPPPGDALQRIYVKENVPGLIFVVSSFSVARNEDIFRSMDYGRTWTHPYNFPRSTDGLRLSVGLSTNTQDIYVNADTDIGGQYFYHSPDDGMTWEYVNLGRFINQIMVDPDKPQTLYASIIGGVHKSTDGGYSWNQIFPGITIFQDRVNPNLLFTIGRPTGIQPGVIISEDRGDSWLHDSTSASLPFKQPGSFNEITWLQYDSGRKRLYLQTEKGIYIRENFLTSVSEEVSPAATKLEVYPQPVREKLEMEMILLPGRSATLRLINPLGQVVLQYSVESNKRITWNLTDNNGYPIPNGVYLMFLFDGVTAHFQRVMVAR